MSISPYEYTIMIINQTEIKNLKNFYLCVACLDNSRCLYNVKFDHNYIQGMPMFNISYNYYASKNYTQMLFGIRADDAVNDIIQD